MKFTAQSEKEIAEAGMLPEGQYPFEISQAEEKLSKAGNEMIVLTVRVYKPDGTFNLVTDYLMESMAYKLRHCAEACGLVERYESGELDETLFVGKTGTLKLGIQKDKTGQYADRNSVKDYIVDGEKVSIPKSPLQEVLDEDDTDDDIPF